MQQPQEIQDWLRDVCKSVIAAGGHNGVPLADWAPVVTDAFPPGEPDRVKHLRTQDFGDSTAVALPPEVRSRPAVEQWSMRHAALPARRCPAHTSALHAEVHDHPSPLMQEVQAAMQAQAQERQNADMLQQVHDPRD